MSTISKVIYMHYILKREEEEVRAELSSALPVCKEITSLNLTHKTLEQTLPSPVTQTKGGSRVDAAFLLLLLLKHKNCKSRGKRIVKQ